MIMKKVTLKDSKGNEINDIMKDVLTFDCETTGLPPKGAKWEDMDLLEECARRGIIEISK